jgi:cytochrome c553
MNLTRAGRLAALIATLLACGATLAEAPAKVATCQACHGAEGVSAAADIPNLAGQKSAYLSRQLEAFKAGTRKNDLMAAIAAQLSPDDIKTLAGFWSGLPAAPAAAATPAAAHAATVSQMSLPKDFPKGFAEYQRDNDPAGQTVAVRWGNAAVLDAARAGRPLPEGSVLITVTHATVPDAQGKPSVEADGRWKLGAVKGYAGMESRAGWGDAIPPLLRNANWNYGLWTPEGVARLGAIQPRCLACHQPKAAESFVFTLAGMRASKP